MVRAFLTDGHFLAVQKDLVQPALIRQSTANHAKIICGGGSRRGIGRDAAIQGVALVTFVFIGARGFLRYLLIPNKPYGRIIINAAIGVQLLRFFAYFADDFVFFYRKSPIRTGLLASGDFLLSPA